jgi:hypothetical protein
MGSHRYPRTSRRVVALVANPGCLVCVLAVFLAMCFLGAALSL